MGVITYGVFRLFDLLVGGRVLPVLVSLIVAVLVYAVVLLKIGTLSEDDILDLPNGEEKISQGQRRNFPSDAVIEQGFSERDRYRNAGSEKHI